MYVKYSDNFGKYSDDRVNTKRREDRKQIQTVGKLSVGYRQVTSFHDGRLKYNLPPGSWCPGIWYLLGHPRQSPLQVCFSEMRSCLVGWNTHCWIQDKSLTLTLWSFCSLIIRRLFGKLDYPSQIAFSPPPTLRLWACCTEVTLCSHHIGHENLPSLVLEIDAPLFPTIIVSNLYFKVLIIHMDLLSISVRNVTCLCSPQGCLSCIEMLPNLMLHSVTPKVSLDTCPWEVS